MADARANAAEISWASGNTFSASLQTGMTTDNFIRRSGMSAGCLRAIRVPDL